jgi:Mn-dependent DtxR family transcriptional regulator
VSKLIEYLEEIDNFEDIEKFPDLSYLDENLYLWLYKLNMKIIKIYEEFYNLLFNDKTYKFHHNFEIYQIIKNYQSSILRQCLENKQKITIETVYSNKYFSFNLYKFLKQIDDRNIEFKSNRIKHDKDKSIEAIIKFYKQNNRLPKFREILETDQYEFTGCYLNNLKCGIIKLTKEQERKLNENIPHWRDKEIRYDRDKNIEAFIKFYKQHNRLPKRDEILETDQYNFKGKYLLNLRYILLTEKQERKLDENIPHWKDKQFRYDKDKNIEALIKFYKQNDRLPKRDEILETDEYEFDGKYLSDLRDVFLTENQKRKLDENIPHWRDKQFRHDKDKNIEAIIKFYKQHNRLPKGNEILETDQYKFKGKYFDRFRFGKLKLSDQQKQRLDDNIPNWSLPKRNRSK